MKKFKFNLQFSFVFLISFSALIHGRIPKTPQIPSTEDKVKTENVQFLSDTKTNFTEFLFESSEIQDSSEDIKPETSISTSILLKDSSSEDVSNNYFPEKESSIPSIEEKLFNTTEFIIEPSTYLETPSSIINTTNFIYNDTNLATIPTTITTIPPSTIPDIIPNVDTSLVLLGFSHFKKYDFNISFLTHFAYLKGKIYSKNLKYPVQISYQRFLRVLENHEANCTKAREFNEKISYLCDVKIENQKMDNIKIIPDFNFILDKPLVFISPLSAIYMDNIEKVERKLDILLNSNLYILNHSQIKDEKNESFTISGIINKPKPNFKKIQLNLKINVEYQNKISQTELNCNIIDVVDDKYTLRCKGEKKRTYILQHSTSFIGDEILLINFDKDEVSRITISGISGTNVEGLSTGGVIAIIIIIIFFGMYI